MNNIEKIEFEEAMITFIPEYYECIDERSSDAFTNGKIYKCLNPNDLESYYNFIDDKNEKNGWTGSNYKHFKPSTKEAYDAQFVVKEPEFVLPEKWAIIITNENKEIVNNYRKQLGLNIRNLEVDWVHLSERHDGTYFHFNKNHFNKHTSCIEITFEQFKKYVLKEEVVEKKVIEPLPQFKIIETIETITKVENNEGNQFFIDDIVIGSKTKIKSKIISFKYNVDKTAILAITDKAPNIGIGINHLEHYIEPKVEVKDDFVLPEKWCITSTLESQKIIFDWLLENTNWKNQVLYL
jgi:hypothetical protein